MTLIVAFKGTKCRDKAFKKLDGVELNTDSGLVHLNARLHQSRLEMYRAELCFNLPVLVVH